MAGGGVPRMNTWCWPEIGGITVNLWFSICKDRYIDVYACVDLRCKDTPIAMNPPSTQTVILKYYSPPKEIRVPWGNG